VVVLCAQQPGRETRRLYAPLCAPARPEKPTDPCTAIDRSGSDNPSDSRHTHPGFVSVLGVWQSDLCT